MSVRVLTQDERRAGLGGTDVAAIVGVSTYRAPIDVWLEKRGDQPPQEQTWRMRLGQLFEDAIADAYAESTGRRLARMGVVFHPRHDFLYVHPDRRVVGQPGLVECKKRVGAAVMSKAWEVQAAWQMALTGRLWVDVVVFDGSDVEPLRVERDQELIDSLVEAAVAFWQDNVVRGAEPGPDGTEAYRHYLARRFPSVSEEERVATPEEVALIDAYLAADAARTTAEEEMARVKGVLGRQMGEAGLLLAPQARVRRLMSSPQPPWKAIATGLAETHGEDIDGLVAAAGTKAPEPYVRVYPRKEG